MAAPRIALISALAESPAPAEAAMREAWPEAWHHNLLDDSLAGDLAAQGHVTPSIFERFLALGRYAAAATDGTAGTAGILFTCSAFRPAIDRVKADLTIPVVSPNEGAFEEALALCAKGSGPGRIGLVLTFQGSLSPLTAELAGIAEAAGQTMPEIASAVAGGALEALQAGDPDMHDRLIAAATATLPPTNVTILGQFSMARAARIVDRPEPLLTTPHPAVRKLRALVEARG
jgi:hypothetical protein